MGCYSILAQSWDELWRFWPVPAISTFEEDNSAESYSTPVARIMLILHRLDAMFSVMFSFIAARILDIECSVHFTGTY